MKLNLSDPKTTKTYCVEVDEKNSLNFLNKKISDKVSLTFISPDLKAEITGGRDKQGSPMYPSLDVTETKKVFLPKGIAFKTKNKGERKRKRVAGRIITPNIQEINLKIISGDTKILEEKYSKSKPEKN